MKELSSIQNKVISLFKKSPLKNKFYWTGGTLLSVLYLQHRQSQDLDFFSDSPFSYYEVIGFVRQLKKELNLPRIEERKIFDRYEFFLHNRKELRIEFVFYPHPKLRQRKKWQGILIDSLEDIAVNKIMAFFDRNDSKDLYDIYFLLTRKNYKIGQLLKLVKKKFGIEFSETNFWSESCKATERLDRIRPLLLLKKSADKNKTIQKVKEYFINQSTKHLHQLMRR